MRSETFENLKKPSMPQKQAAEFASVVSVAKEFARGGTSWHWLVLAGSLGWGKTHIGMAILVARTEHHPDWGPLGVYASTPTLLEELRRGYEDGTYHSALEAYMEMPLLMIDDLGTEYRKARDDGSSWSEDKVYQIINHRYDNHLQTVITTNVRPSKIDPRIAERVMDQGTGLCKVFDKKLPSFRTGRIVEPRAR